MSCQWRMWKEKLTLLESLSLINHLEHRLFYLTFSKPCLQYETVKMPHLPSGGTCQTRARSRWCCLIRRCLRNSRGFHTWNRFTQVHSTCYSHTRGRFTHLLFWNSQWHKVDSSGSALPSYAVFPLSSAGFISNMSAHRQYFPDEEDQTGAAKALMRLQDTYQLDSEAFSRGKLPGDRGHHTNHRYVEREINVSFMRGRRGKRSTCNGFYCVQTILTSSWVHFMGFT